MSHITVLKTFFSRFLVLLLNFGLVVYTVNMWGSGGKGVISMVIADLTIISFFTNIFVGSTISYFASKFKTEEILPFAYLWSLASGVLIATVFSFVHRSEYSNYLLILCVVSSLLTANINLFVGKKNVHLFNVYSVAQYLIHFVFILIFVYAVRLTSVSVYFAAQIAGFGILFLISTFQIFRNCEFKVISVSKNIVRQLFQYGWRTQLSAFLQFLNYRLSFYFLESFKGIASVGIFSVGVVFAEAIWMVSRSLSVVLYADLVNSSDAEIAITKTKAAIRVSFFVTLLFLLITFMIPVQFYVAVFGKDFIQTKEIILLLSPGILAIAVSNIIGYYFAGINKLRILNVKSIVGLLFTVVASYFIIPKWGITGACVVTTISYCLSSAILFWRFYQLTDFNVKDFMLSKSEFLLIVKRIAKRA